MNCTHIEYTAPDLCDEMQSLLLTSAQAKLVEAFYQDSLPISHWKEDQLFFSVSAGAVNPAPQDCRLHFSKVAEAFVRVKVNAVLLLSYGRKAVFIFFKALT